MTVASVQNQMLVMQIQINKQPFTFLQIDKIHKTLYSRDRVSKFGLKMAYYTPECSNIYSAPPKQLPEQQFKMGHDQLFPHPLQLVVHQ